jgi:hypothetical protein
MKPVIISCTAKKKLPASTNTSTKQHQKKAYVKQMPVRSQPGSRITRLFTTLGRAKRLLKRDPAKATELASAYANDIQAGTPHVLAVRAAQQRWADAFPPAPVADDEGDEDTDA